MATQIESRSGLPDPDLYFPGAAKLGIGIVSVVLGVSVAIVAMRLFSFVDADSYRGHWDKAVSIFLGAAVALTIYSLGTILIRLRRAVEELRAASRSSGRSDSH